MEETFSSLVHPLLPPLSILSASPGAARTPDREPRAPPAPRGAPLARGCVSPRPGLGAVNICRPPRPSERDAGGRRTRPRWARAEWERRGRGASAGISTAEPKPRTTRVGAAGSKGRVLIARSGFRGASCWVSLGGRPRGCSSLPRACEALGFAPNPSRPWPVSLVPHPHPHSCIVTFLFVPKL